MKKKVSSLILAVLCASCSTYHTDSILRGRPIAPEKVDKLSIGITSLDEVSKSLGKPYYQGTYGDMEMMGYIFVSGEVVSHEHNRYGFSKIQRTQFPEMDNWQQFTLRPDRDKIAITELKNWNESSLWLKFQKGVLVDFLYSATPAQNPTGSKSKR